MVGYGTTGTPSGYISGSAGTTVKRIGQNVVGAFLGGFAACGDDGGAGTGGSSGESCAPLCDDCVGDQCSLTCAESDGVCTLACLDGADGSTLTPKRTESVTAPQALALLNNEFILVHAKAMAARLEKHSAERAKQIDLACRLAWGRGPSADEAKLFAAYADKHGLANLCRVLFNTNEFLFAD